MKMALKLQDEDLIAQDQLHRKLALDPTKSFIIQAPAGSGKTELLVQRFLTLLSTVKSPDEILAITFTKKAANEMRDRIIKALKDAKENIFSDTTHKKMTSGLAKKVLMKDLQLNWQLVQNPNQLRIQTIDALCANLTKQLPLLSTFGAPPSIAEDPHFLYREAIAHAFLQLDENNEWSHAISNLLLHLDNDINKLLHLLVQLLEKRDQWLNYIQLNMDNVSLRKELGHHLSLVVTDHLTKLKACMPKEIVPELMALVRFAASSLALQKKPSKIRACLDLSALPQTSAEDKDKWIGIAHLLLTKNFSWRKRLDSDIGFIAKSNIKNTEEKEIQEDAKRRLSALIESMSNREELRKSLQSLFFLPGLTYDNQQWEILKSLLTVLKVVVAELRLAFQQHGQIDFVENGKAALIALGATDDPTDLALSLDYQLRHILIDEFQDTSHTQYQLIEKLTAGWMNDDGRTLFVVGDPMQSIYRFREAEVGLFIHMIKHGISEIKLTPLTLTLNFRSSPAITNWNNEHFQKIFPPFDDIASGAVSYSHCLSNKMDVGLRKNESAIVKIEGAINATDEMQATSIIDLVKSIKEQRPHEKIAILVRSRSHLSEIVPALKKAKISYLAHEIDPLASRQTIQDLLSLTGALLHPSDRIAWLSVLRAPWSGLSLSDLLYLTVKSPHTSLQEMLFDNAIIETLSADAKLRLARVVPILKSKVLERGRHDLRYWIESTWLQLGGPACVADHNELDDINTFFNLLSEIDFKSGPINIETLKEKVNKLYASTQADETLEIMTIHAAKGLEFDTVIVPHLERRGATDDKPLFSWMEQPLNDGRPILLLAPIASGKEKDPIYEYINRGLKNKSDYERDRLFYVATTRAIKNLYLFFNVEQEDDGEFKIRPNSFLEKLWPLIEKQKANICKKNPTITQPNGLLNTKKHVHRLVSSWKNPIEDKAILVSRHQQSKGFKLPDNQLKIIGIITHFILQKLSLEGACWWQDQSFETQLDYIKNQLASVYVRQALAQTAALLIHKMVKNTLDCDKGKWILHPHQEAKSEFAITAIIDEKPENLIIDRTFIDENGVRWIIDYKTAMQTHSDLETFLQKEEKKYIEQMNKYYQALKLLGDQKIRIGLYFPALPHFWECGLE
jgi:ATP-dependent exoDNAse (exonuclease V) beta subunit